jgi:hypothetical protein
MKAMIGVQAWMGTPPPNAADVCMGVCLCVCCVCTCRPGVMRNLACYMFGEVWCVRASLLYGASFVCVQAFLRRVRNAQYKYVSRISLIHQNTRYACLVGMQLAA